MLPNDGYFSLIPCPYFESEICERPHCQFRHIKKENTRSRKYSAKSNNSQKKTENIKESGKKESTKRDVHETSKAVLNQKDLRGKAGDSSVDPNATYTNIVKHFLPEVKSNASTSKSCNSLDFSYSAIEEIPSYKPTPIAELSKRNTVIQYAPTDPSVDITKSRKKIEYSPLLPSKCLVRYEPLAEYCPAGPSYNYTYIPSQIVSKNDTSSGSRLSQDEKLNGDFIEHKKRKNYETNIKKSKLLNRSEYSAGTSSAQLENSIQNPTNMSKKKKRYTLVKEEQYHPTKIIPETQKYHPFPIKKTDSRNNPSEVETIEVHDSSSDECLSLPFRFEDMSTPEAQSSDPIKFDTNSYKIPSTSAPTNALCDRWRKARENILRSPGGKIKISSVPNVTSLLNAKDLLMSSTFQPNQFSEKRDLTTKTMPRSVSIIMEEGVKKKMPISRVPPTYFSGHPGPSTLD